MPAAACAEQCVYACLIKKDEMVSKEKQCMSLSMFATFATQILAPDEVKYIIIPS